MRQTISAHWHFSRFMGKGFVKLQLFDSRNNTSFFCEEIPEHTHDK